MPAGASKKREREYGTLKKRFASSGRYKGREEEVAARIVNKQRRRFGETKEAKKKRASGEAPDKELPLKDYQHLTAAQVISKLPSLSAAQRGKIRKYEGAHKNRKTLLQHLGA